MIGAVLKEGRRAGVVEQHLFCQMSGSSSLRILTIARLARFRRIVDVLDFRENLD